MATDDQSATPAGTPSPKPANGRWRFMHAWPYALILVVGAFVLLPALGSFGFWDPWESTHVAAAQEMRGRGSLFVPYFDGEVRLTEPVLTYWGILLGSAVFGLNELGARIGGVCMALVAMLGVYYGVARMRGRVAGLLAALVLATSPLFYFLARQAMPEIYLLTTTGLSLVFFCLALFRDDERRRVHFAIGCAGLALSVLSRGPLIAGSAVLAPLALYGLSRIGGGDRPVAGRQAGGTSRAVPKSMVLRAIVVFAVIVVVVAGAWYAITLVRYGGGFLLNVQPTPEDSRADGFGDYFRGWIFGFFPWSCFLPLTLIASAAISRRESKEDYGLETCLLLSCLATFVAISIPLAKTPQALAPVTVPAAVLVGLTLHRMSRGRRDAARGTFPGVRLAWAVAAMLYMPVLVDLRGDRGLRYLLGSFTVERHVPKDFEPAAFFSASLVLFAGVLLVSIVFRSRYLVAVLVGLAALIGAHNAWLLVPAATPDKTMKVLCETWKDLDPGDAPLGFYREMKPSARLYSDGRVRRLEEPSEFMRHMAPEQPAYSVVENELLVEIDQAYRRNFEGHRLYLHGRNDDYVLIGNRPERDG